MVTFYIYVLNSGYINLDRKPNLFLGVE